MGTAFRVVNVITEAQYILVEFIHILEGHFHRDSLALAGKENDIMYGLLGMVHILYKANDTFRLMIGDLLRLFFSFIFKNDRKLRVQVSGLMKTALNIIFLETGLVEDGIIRQEIDGRTGLSGLAHYGKQTVHQIHHGDTSFITVLIDEATTLDSYSQLCGKSIYHRGTYAVQTTAGLVGGIIEFTAGMKSREYQALRTDSFFVHSHGNTTSVIFHGCGAVGFQCHLYRITISGQMLVHRVINDLVDQMIQSLGGDTADIHSGSFSYRFQTFQNGNT